MEWMIHMSGSCSPGTPTSVVCVCVLFSDLFYNGKRPFSKRGGGVDFTGYTQTQCTTLHIHSNRQ